MKLAAAKSLDLKLKSFQIHSENLCAKSIQSKGWTSEILRLLILIQDPQLAWKAARCLNWFYRFDRDATLATSHLKLCQIKPKGVYSPPALFKSASLECSFTAGTSWHMHRNSSLLNLFVSVLWNLWSVAHMLTAHAPLECFTLLNTWLPCKQGQNIVIEEDKKN